MDPLLNIVNKLLVPPWNYVLTAIGVLLVVVPKVIELQKSVRTLRRDREKMENEIKRLQLIKLRYEVEVLRKQHDLPEIADIPGIVAGSRGVSARGARESVSFPGDGPMVPKRGPIFRWLAAHPVIGESALWALQALVGALLLVSAICIVLVPVAVVVYPERGLSQWMAPVGMLIYGAIAYGLFGAFKRLRRLREAL
jgi:hypothetical protein